MNFAGIPGQVLFVLFIWSLIWKGLALWHAASLKQKYWFIVLLVLNTAGILEILYLFVFAQKRFDYHNFFFWKK